MLKSTKLELICSSELTCNGQLESYLKPYMTTHPIFDFIYHYMVNPLDPGTLLNFYSRIRTFEKENSPLHYSLESYYLLSTLFREAMWATSQICNDGMFCY